MMSRSDASQPLHFNRSNPGNTDGSTVKLAPQRRHWLTA